MVVREDLSRRLHGYGHGQSPNVLRFLVPGRPVPCQRSRAFILPGGKGVGHYTDVETRSYEQLVRLHAISAMAGTRWTVGGTGPFALVLDVYRVRRSGDADNFAKGIKDGLTKARAWDDDRYVEDLHVRLHVDKLHPRVIVEVRELHPKGT